MDTHDPFEELELDEEFSRWLMDRYDRWRSSIAQRAALVVSGDALLIAGNSFLVNQAIEMRGESPPLYLMLIGLSVSLSTIVLLASLLLAVNGVANVWGTSRSMFGANMPDRWPYHPSDVIKAGSYQGFANLAATLGKKDIKHATVAELWTLAKMHHQRYQQLRRSIRLMCLSVPFYLTALGTIIAWTLT